MARAPSTARARRLLPALPLALVLWVGGSTSCRNVRFYERERLSDRTMGFELDPLQAELREHVLTPREAAMGGFSSAGAGGCGCH